MGCRCGQNKRAQPSGAATYSPPPKTQPLRSMPAGVTAEAVSTAAPTVWFRVDVPRDDGTVDSVWWVSDQDAIAFAQGRYPVTKTTTPPPVQVR